MPFQSEELAGPEPPGGSGSAAGNLGSRDPANALPNIPVVVVTGEKNASSRTVNQLEDIAGGMRTLLSVEPSCWSRDDVENVLLGMYELLSQLSVVRSRAIRRAGELGFSAQRGAPDLVGWMREQMQVAPGDARRLIAVAQAVVGGPCQATGVALAQGRISPEQADVILRAVRGFPGQASDEQRRAMQAALLADAIRMDRHQLTRSAAQLTEKLLAADRPADEEKRHDTGAAGSGMAGSGDKPDATCGGGEDGPVDAGDAPPVGDGCSPESESSGPGQGSGPGQSGGSAPRPDPQAVRQLTFFDTPQGTTLVRGELDAEGAALLRTALDGLSAPRPGEDGARDPRTPARRRADALVELVSRALSGNRVPKSGGTRPHLTVTIAWSTLISGGLGSATTSWGMPLPLEVIRRISCDAAVGRIILDPNGVPLDAGRSVRTVPPHMRRDLVS